jgi:hypothetical protein
MDYARNLSFVAMRALVGKMGELCCVDLKMGVSEVDWNFQERK